MLGVIHITKKYSNIKDKIIVHSYIYSKYKIWIAGGSSKVGTWDQESGWTGEKTGSPRVRIPVFAIQIGD